MRNRKPPAYALQAARDYRNSILYRKHRPKTLAAVLLYMALTRKRRKKT